MLVLVGIAALVTGVTAMGQVERALNRLYGIEQDRPTVQKYERALVLALTAGMLATIAFVMLAIGHSIGESLRDGTSEVAWQIVRWPIALVLITAAVALLFRCAPRREQPAWSWLAFGAVISVTLWSLVTLALGLFFDATTTFSLTYGSLAGMIALLLWALLSSVAILFGAAVTAQLEAIRALAAAPWDEAKAVNFSEDPRLRDPRAAETLMRLDKWFLQASERGNPTTDIDRRHGDDTAWTEGNDGALLLDGAAYFARLHGVLGEAQPGDWVYFTDWQGDPDERLDGPGTEVGHVIAGLAHRGVHVRGLLWRSHPEAMNFGERENLSFTRVVNEAGGEVLLDQRVRRGGSHHQKIVRGAPRRSRRRRRLRRRHRPVPRTSRRRPPSRRPAGRGAGRRALRRAATMARPATGSPRSRSGRHHVHRSRSAGTTRPRSTPATPCAPRSTVSHDNRAHPVHSRRVDVPNPAVRWPSRFCAPIRRTGGPIRSHRAVSSASPARTSRPSGAPGVSSTSRTSTSGRATRPTPCATHSRPTPSCSSPS